MILLIISLCITAIACTLLLGRISRTLEEIRDGILDEEDDDE